jgi:hypothetical protein
MRPEDILQLVVDVTAVTLAKQIVRDVSKTADAKSGPGRESRYDGVGAGNVIPLQNVLYALVWRRKRWARVCVEADDDEVQVEYSMCKLADCAACLEEVLCGVASWESSVFIHRTRDIIPAAKTCNDAMQGTMLLLETLTTACFSVVASFDSSCTSTACLGCLFLTKCQTFAKRDQQTPPLSDRRPNHHVSRWRVSNFTCRSGDDAAIKLHLRSLRI